MKKLSGISFLALILCLGLVFGYGHKAEASSKKFLTFSKPTFVFYTAEWCGYCKKFEAVYQELESKFKGKIKFYRIDIERDTDLVKKYWPGAPFVPRFQFYDKFGNLKDSSWGGQTKESILPKFQKNFGLK